MSMLCLFGLVSAAPAGAAEPAPTDAVPTDAVPNRLPRIANPPAVGAERAELGSDAAVEPDGAEGGRLEVDAKVPAEILLSGVKLGQLYFPGEARFTIVPGEHLLRIYVNGKPTDVPVSLRAGERTRVLVGRSGVTVQAVEDGAAPPELGPVSVQFRLVGGGSARLQLDGRPVALQSGDPVTVDLGVGTHPLSVRSVDGTAIWASGVLEVQGGDTLVVQVAEGRLPEVSGPGRFH